MLSGTFFYEAKTFEKYFSQSLWGIKKRFIMLQEVLGS